MALRAAREATREEIDLLIAIGAKEWEQFAYLHEFCQSLDAYRQNTSWVGVEWFSPKRRWYLLEEEES